jgi:hypothetical protein
MAIIGEMNPLRDEHSPPKVKKVKTLWPAAERLKSSLRIEVKLKQRRT